MFFFFFNILNALSEKEGAIIISIKILLISSAVFSSTSLFATTIPPKIDFGSDVYAFIYASYIFSPLPTPQGFACLHATTDGSENSFDNSSAPFVSFILLKLKAFPCNCIAFVKNPFVLSISL